MKENKHLTSPAAVAIVEAAAAAAAAAASAAKVACRAVKCGVGGAKAGFNRGGGA